MLKLNLWFYLIFSIFIANTNCKCSIKCLDEDGMPVDWYVLYKLPRIPNHANINIQQGVGYLYRTSESLSTEWTLSDLPITSNGSFPGRTISYIFQANNSAENEVNNDLIWLLYNDQPPDKNFSEIFGHTKGTVIGNQNGGLWLVHSVPHFPSLDEGQYMYPKTAYRYGQSLLCISMNQPDLDNVGLQIMLNEAWVYNSHIEEDMQNIYPNLYSATKKKKPTALTHKQLIYSVGQQKFVSFAKSSKFEKDLYSKWVAADLQSELIVETWTHGSRLPTDCNETYPVHNINSISLANDTINFKSSSDHSKWAASFSGAKPWICIGDINRIDDQLQRGGGTVCFQNAALWSLYLHSANIIDPCPAKRKSYLDPNFWLG